MKQAKVARFDAADYLDSEEAIAAYLNAALEEDDIDLLITVLADIVKARGVAKIAEDAGLGRESLYKTLKPGSKPQIGTIFKLIHALGIKLVAQPDSAHA